MKYIYFITRDGLRPLQTARVFEQKLKKDLEQSFKQILSHIAREHFTDVIHGL